MNQRRYQPQRRTNQLSAGVVALAIVLPFGGWALVLNPEPVQVGSRGDIPQAHLDFHGGSGTSSRNAFFALPLVLFGDGFEPDDTEAWSSTTP